MRLFQRGQRSLFGEILDWMLTPLLILWPISLFLTWLVAQNIAGHPFDHALALQVKALARHVRFDGQQARFTPPQPAQELLHGDDEDALRFQVLGTKGELLAGEQGLAPPALPSENDEDTAPGIVHWRDDVLGKQPVRVAALWISSPAQTNQQALVQVAETRRKRTGLTTDIITSVFLPQLAILPLAILLIWLALAQAILPLNHLADRIRRRNSDDLSALETQTVPQEVAPLVTSMNDLLERLQHSITTQKRFLADAAHQLKTPLAGLRMQAELALRNNKDDNAAAQELKQSLQQIARASANAAHTVNQLLALARAEASAAAIQQQRCDLARIVMQVVQDSVPRALEKGLDLGYEGLEASRDGLDSVVEGNPILLQELTRNLVDNAIHYTAPGGMVTARVLSAQRDGKLVVILHVEDDGPGIPEAERERVFQPFYRVLGTQADGSGLGLSIVQEIACQHRATITVEDARPGQQPPGTRFTVVFPAA